MMCCLEDCYTCGCRIVIHTLACQHAAHTDITACELHRSKFEQYSPWTFKRWLDEETGKSNF